MNKNILLAGGFKNHNLTSYINCTLQIFLHYQPFIEEINIKPPNDDNNFLISSLRVLINKLNTTDTSISSDSIISAMKIDPKIFQPINSFFLFFRYLVEFDIIKFEFEKCETSIQNEIDCYLQKPTDFNNNDLNNDFLYIHVNPNNQQSFHVDQDISILDFSFTLYAVVQVIISPASHNHYFVTIHDRKGWVVFNDTAVREISDTHFNNSLYNLATPIEILVYIKNLDDVKINRRPASLKSTFIPIIDQNKSINKSNQDNPNINDDYDRDANSHDIESYVVKRNSYPDDKCFNDSFTKSNRVVYEVSNESTDDEPKEIQPFRNKILLINSDPHRQRNMIKDANYVSDEEDQSDFKKETHPSNSFGIFSSFQKEKQDFSDEDSQNSQKGRLFDSYRYTYSPTEECKVFIKCFTNTNKEYTKIFNINDTCNNIFIFGREISHSSSAKIYLKYKSRYFKVSPDKKIKDIQQLIYQNDLHFLAVTGKRPPDIYSIALPVYLTEHCFQKIFDVQLICNIDDDIFTLINIFSKKNLHYIGNPIILQFIIDDHKFVEIPMSEKIIKVLDYTDLRIQQRPKNLGESIVFVYKEPFLFHVDKHITKSDLIIDISKYLRIEHHITLSFIDEDGHQVNIYNEFLESYHNNFFSYILVQ